MTISDDCVVCIHYTLTNDQGEVLDSSDGGEPLAYLQGAGNIIPGLENALKGHQVGDKLAVSIAPADGYGERDEELVQAVPREAFKDFPDIEEGMTFQARTDHGTQMLTVVEIGDQEVTVDGNHPLAGETLNFHVEVTEVRKASKEEKAHGHVHGAHGHHH